jgi:carbon storage regulator CsrA
MLVLSRKPQEKIVLPTLGVTVQVLGIRPGVVRLGIDAPPEVPILRAEVPHRAAEWGPERPPALGEAQAQGDRDKLPRQLHARLQTTGIGLGLLRLQLDIGDLEEARQILAALQHDFQVVLYGLKGEAEDRPAPPAARDPRRQRALLVEDDRNERELLAGFLRQSGLDVDTAGDGADALDYLRTHARPDMVHLDMGLPRVDGPTMVREIRRNPALADLKVFGVTGYQPEEFGLENGPGGIDRWFQKPLDPAALLHDLREELEAHSLCPV